VTTAPSRSERQRLRLPLATAALGASVLLPARLSGAREAQAAGRSSNASTRPVPDASLRPTRVALLGDTPYSPAEEWRLLRVFERLPGKVEWVLHVGDLKASREPCTDALLERRIALLDRCPLPLIYTPGDNEWLDCWRDPTADVDPVERLSWLRRRVFGRQSPLLGASAAASSELLAGLERQSSADDGPPENLCWLAGSAVWITLNLPGSGNGLLASLDDQHRIDRDAANRRWMRAALARARASALPAIVVVAHANPGFERARPDDGYAPFRADLLELQRDFGKPVLLMHGDTHRFRHNWITPGLLRVECFGSPFAESWVSVRVDGASEQPFLVSAEHL
jgi:hypothetical protein